jgi:8-oxo-dGTP pyrophosphatase MutT (NUDIX family)
MARHERSAGILLFRMSKSGRKFLLLDYGHHWDLPKGHVEGGEDLLQAAMRELQEETGITDAHVIPGFSHEIRYFFRNKKKELVHKTVWFCLGETWTSKVRLSDEHVGFKYLPFEEALERLTYPAAKSLLRHAQEFLDSGGQS